jgi:hypothetical protein
MDYLGRTGHDERTIEELVLKIHDTFEEALGLLNDRCNGEPLRSFTIL